MTKVLIYDGGYEFVYKEAWETWEEPYGKVLEISDLSLADWSITMIRYDALQMALGEILYGD